MHDTAYARPRAAHSYKVYPRGFLGAQLHDRVQKEMQLQQDNNGFVPVKVSSYKKANGVNDFNHAVEELYGSYIREDATSTGFEFRERVLKVALAAFGTGSFTGWFLAQLESPFVGSMQRDFLDDCLRFLNKGQRELCLENWAALLVISNADEGDMRPSQFASDYLGLARHGQVAASLSVPDMVQEWCSRPNGFQDLLGTLHILFGAAP